MRQTPLILLAALSLAVVPATFAQNPKKGTDLVVVIVDKDRSAFVRWMLPENNYPRGGFRLERSVNGKAREVLAELSPAGPGATGVAPEVADAIQRYLVLSWDPDRAASPQKREQFEMAQFAVQVLAIGDPAIARALGLSFVDKSAPAGATAVYSITALGAGGTPEAAYATSQPTVIAPMPLPSPPEALRGEPTRAAVLLYWHPATADEDKPYGSIAYEVLRRDSPAAAAVRVSPQPVLLARTATPEGKELPAFHDPKPPVEKAALYTVVGLDLAGRRGPESAPIEVFCPDFGALDPPQAVAPAAAQGGGVRIAWAPVANANVAGVVVSRAFNAGGPYQPLTPRPVSGGEFVDTAGRVGASYFYRVATVTKRGVEGTPSSPVNAVFHAGRPPAAPQGLTAECKTGKVILRWNAAEIDALQGFRVERDAGDEAWTIISPLPAPEPRFDDNLPADVLGTMRYRVTAIALDGEVSPPSAIVTVPLPRTRPAARPAISSIDGRGGRVALEWRPTGERGDASAFLILRSESKGDVGLIVNDAPLAASITTYVDDAVTAGSDYYYSVVALDDAGNRSEPSEPAAVHVGDPPLEPPPAPKLRYEARPFPRVTAQFPVPSNPSARVVLERRRDDGTWVAITGVLARDATQAIDSRPPQGRTTAYRLAAVAANGAPGPVSPPAEIKVP